MLTISVIKADTGGFVGHSAVYLDMLQQARQRIDRAVQSELLYDGQVAACGDDLALIMTHQHGEESELVHGFA